MSEDTYVVRSRIYDLVVACFRLAKAAKSEEINEDGTLKVPVTTIVREAISHNNANSEHKLSSNADGGTNGVYNQLFKFMVPDYADTYHPAVSIAKLVAPDRRGKSNQGIFLHGLRKAPLTVDSFKAKMFTFFETVFMDLHGNGIDKTSSSDVTKSSSKVIRIIGGEERSVVSGATKLDQKPRNMVADMESIRILRDRKTHAAQLTVLYAHPRLSRNDLAGKIAEAVGCAQEQVLVAFKHPDWLAMPRDEFEKLRADLQEKLLSPRAQQPELPIGDDQQFLTVAQYKQQQEELQSTLAQILARLPQ